MLRKTGSWQNFYLTSGASDLLLRRLAELVRAHGERGFQFAVTQNLDSGARFANQAAGNQQFGRHRLSRRKCVERFHVHHGILETGRIVEAALRDSPTQRHLAALKPRTPRVALARFLSFVAFAGRPAELRAHPAAHAHLAMPRSPCRLQIGKIHSHRFLNFLFCLSFNFTYSSTTTRCRTFRIIPRMAGVSSRSTTCCIRRNPRPRMVARMPFGQPMKLTTHLILSLPDFFVGVTMFVPGAVSARVPPPSSSEVPRPWPHLSDAAVHRRWL